MTAASAYTPTDSGWGLWFLVAVVVLATVAVGVAWIAVAAEPHSQTLPGDPRFVGHVADGSPVLDDPLDQPPSPLRRERGVLVGQPLLGRPLAASSLIEEHWPNEGDR